MSRSHAMREGGQLAWLNLRARRICTQGFIILCLFWRPSFYIAQVQVLLGAGRLFRFDPLRLRCLVVKGFCLSCLKSLGPNSKAAVMRCVSPFVESGIAKRVDSETEGDSQK